MRRLIPLLAVLMLLGACSTIDCPLSTKVCCTYQLAGDVLVLTDTLSVTSTRADGNDAVLLNQISGDSIFRLPMSYAHDTDVLFFAFTDKDRVTRTDTVTVSKTNIPHFESVDCSPSFFHLLGDVKHTRHVIDQIIITNSTINYDTTAVHLQIYLQPGH